jgi:hypothetical protein
MTAEAASRKMATRQKVHLACSSSSRSPSPITINYGTCADTRPNKVIEHSWSRLQKFDFFFDIQYSIFNN